MIHKLIFLLILIILSTICFAQSVQIPKIEFSPRRYICYYTDTSLTIDGKLNETVWGNTEWTKDFVDIEGSSKPTPRFRTHVKMLWDSSYFYIGVELQEPDIWATLTQRDTIIYHDNDFEVFIDPDGDTHRYAEFEMNALNTVFDLLLIKPYRDTYKAPIIGWDIAGLKTAVSINGTLNDPSDRDKFWIVELAFPWKAFREITRVAVPPNDKDQWKVNFSRVQYKTEVKNGSYKKLINPETRKPYQDNWVWSPQGVLDMHYPEMWGFVQFSTNSPRESGVQFVEKKEEAAKWYLRQVYYHERNYFDTIGTFTTDLKKLGITSEAVPGFKMPASIECTSHYFEVRLQSHNGTENIFIRNDGRVWIEHTMNNPVKK